MYNGTMKITQPSKHKDWLILDYQNPRYFHDTEILNFLNLLLFQLTFQILMERIWVIFGMRKLLELR